MRNSVKTLIVGVVLAEVAFGAYLLLPKSDPATESPDSSGIRASSFSDADTDYKHVIAGNIVSAPRNAAANTGATASNQSANQLANQSAAPRATAEPQPSNANAYANVAQAPQPHVGEVHVYAPPATVTSAASVANVAPAAPVAAVTPAAPVDQQAAAAARAPANRDVARDGLRRHYSNSVSAAMTDQLVKESAKLDPNLPPPDPSYHDDPSFRADTSTRRTSNPVANAMTDQLVRESSKLDPNLPPPNPASAR